MTTATPTQASTSASSAKDAPETVVVAETTVACDGGGGALGHPTVYLKIGPAGTVTCPYCSRHFQLDANAPASSAH